MTYLSPAGINTGKASPTEEQKILTEKAFKSIQMIIPFSFPNMDMGDVLNVCAVRTTKGSWA